MGQAQQGMGTTASAQFPHSEPDSLQRETTEPNANKLSKEEVNYRLAGSSDTRCSNCEHYMGDNTCAVVGGVINPDGVSDAWTPQKRGLQDLVAPPPIGGPV